MKKILLINPAFCDGREFRNRFDDYIEWIKAGNLYVAPFEPPIGLACLSAFLKERGHEVHIIDMQGLLMDSGELTRRIADYRPDLIGITAMTTTLPEALQVAGLSRSCAPQTAVVLGGVHPTLDPEGVLASVHVDFVIRGEGEIAFAGLVDVLENGGSFEMVDGLSYKIGGKPVIAAKAAEIGNLDRLPLPDYDAFPVERYIEHNRYLRGIRGISVIVSRGCPFRCTFCAVHQTMGKKWRAKSPGRVVDELITLRDRYGIEGVWFKDSIFNLNRKWVDEFCRLMINRKAGLTWQALTRVNMIDEKELQLMKEAGLTQLDLGIESGSPRILSRLKKDITVDIIREKVALARKYVRVFGFFMIGIPGEEITDVEETFALARNLDLDRWSWSIYTPLPGSALYDELIDEGKIEPYRFNYHQIHFTEAYEGICNIPPEKLKAMYTEINEYFAKRMC